MKKMIVVCANNILSVLCVTQSALTRGDVLVGERFFLSSVGHRVVAYRGERFRLRGLLLTAIVLCMHTQIMAYLDAVASKWGKIRRERKEDNRKTRY